MAEPAQWRCEYCGEEFPDECDAQGHEAKCPGNPRMDPLASDDWDLRACGTCQLRDAGGYVSVECPHRPCKPRKDCPGWRVARDLFWGAAPGLRSNLPEELGPR
jgi:hypothetical protein